MLPKRVILLAVLAAACAGDRSDASPESTSSAAAVATIRDPGYYAGSPEAPLTVIEFSDFGCGYCRVFAMETYPALHRDYVETGRVRWRFVAFSVGRFPNAERAAIAAECAAEQDEAHFWAMKSGLFAAQSEWRSGGDARFIQLAREVGLDETSFRACLDSPGAAARLRRSNAMAQLGSITGTPTFIIEGRRVLGAVPEAQFRGVLEAMLRPREAR